ncbi:phage tail assembly chaperone [Rhodobacteraceae bacterium 63075]|nr:phage tail assembly chaperone [Rhodobacteraceae bacterium 63075]
MQRIDWARLLAVGLTRLGLKPAEFWALSPAELMLMLEPMGGARPLDSTGLDALLSAYPDQQREIPDE